MKKRIVEQMEYGQSREVMEEFGAWERSILDAISDKVEMVNFS